MPKVLDILTVWRRESNLATGIETRATILGHMQRVEANSKDRVYASMMGAYAVDLLCAGRQPCCWIPERKIHGYGH